MKAFTVTGPTYWASYFINGDDSGLSTEEKQQANSWLEREDICRHEICGMKKNSERFTRSYALHAPECRCSGGDVCDYIYLR